MKTCKNCKNCKIEKDESEFYPKGKKGKYESQCKECCREYKRNKYLEISKEDRLKRNKCNQEYYAKHKDELRPHLTEKLRKYREMKKNDIAINKMRN